MNIGVRARMRAMTFGAAVALTALSTAGTAATPVEQPNTVTYSLTTDVSIDNGLAFIQQAGTGKLFFVPPGFTIDPPGVPAFPIDTKKAAAVERTLLLGTWTEAPAADAAARLALAGVQHLVIGVNKTFAAFALTPQGGGLTGPDFSVLFPGTFADGTAFDEDRLIADLAFLNTNRGSGSTQYQDIIAFGNAVAGAMGGDPAFKPPGDFALLAFSSARLVGGGTVSQTAVPTPGVPEPATWAMLIGGFAFAGGALRRRRTVRVRYA